jgi:hypothetical protein
VTVSVTYTDPSAKTTVAITSAPANASSALIERSTDQITWTTVRGATSLPLSGSAASIDDYEFCDGMVNYYRATYFDSSIPAAVGTPAAATVVTSAGASASVTPTLPTGLSIGDVVMVTIANTKATASNPAAPAGWTLLALDGDGLAVYCADWSASLTIPAFTVTGLASADKVIGKATAIRNVGPALGNAQSQVNAASTAISWPAFGTLPGTAQAGPIIGFSRSVSTASSPTGDTRDTGTGYTLVTWIVTIPSYGAGAFTLSGATSATSSVLQVNMAARAYVSQETGTVTPALSSVWIKDPLRPYLNRAVTLINVDTVKRAARTGVFAIIARSLPVAVTDLVGGRTTTMTLRCTTPAIASDIVSCLTTGETQFVHTPHGSRMPSLYCVLGELDVVFPSQTGPSRQITVPVTEVVAPSPYLAAVLSSWQTVVSTYATWSALIAAKATWADVLLLVGSPTDVFVP